jgi:glycosyltransferase involved in cell wall biosynthesis
MNNPPFLTVVTRCFKRPLLLKENVRSLKAQTDPDYEQVFIIDRKGQGLAAADKALNEYKHLNTGQYILVLDDDDKVLEADFIASIKGTAKSKDPDVMIWRGRFGKGYLTDLPPKDTNWGKTIVKAKIGSFNYAIKNELYEKYIHVCKTGIAGDFDFLKRVLNSSADLKVIWIDRTFVGIQVKSKGRPVQSIRNVGNKRILSRRKNRWR